MKIHCDCGHVIHDCALSSKASLIPGQAWESFWESIDEAVEQSGPTAKEKEAACMQLRYLKVARSMWQCPECGKLYINGANGELHVYAPVADASKSILS